MYCDGNCEFLDKKHKKCKADGTIIAYMRVRGRNLAYACYEHRVGCVKDREEKLMEKLKPCPFCGHRIDIKKDVYDPSND